MQKGNIFEHRFTISESVYNGFIGLFNDKNPLHTDVEFAKEKGFESKIMHGNILNGFISYFIGECLPVKNLIIHSQEIKFTNPVYLNEELNFQAEVTDVFQSVNVIEFKFKFLNASGKKAASGKINIGII
jgi:3-hydroxybutyryl-CoA dehydratase